MFHVSFRYIFGLPPLILVLLPVASSDCDIEGKDGKQYESVLMVSIDQLLDSMKEIGSNCLNNEFNFFKRHLCDDNKVKGRKPAALGEPQPTKSLEENKSLKEQKKLNDSCFLKRLLQKIKTCWNKILMGTKEH
ncbi:interleukin-7 isoform X2 [Papio anubis]|uniref:Interleukin-7 n=8 Tax=Cercopithecidae TaxID=9527 RepID=A0A2K5MFD4_CERAT|nr:PREDICTED: interleukin-7 isoform X3 [Colobus angolensis palliatus]XP_011844458.1 PREDICTED: interleukin-7 isoform X3 [Mandrillus leucophaeus]XP_021798145.1 interleukin-7 isoform X2 [Papio anubis]